MQRRRWFRVGSAAKLTTAVTALATLGACGPGRPQVPAATVPAGPGPAAPPATVGATAAGGTTVAPDVFAVPDVIDEAYVNRVLVALNVTAGDALRAMTRDKKVTAEVLTHLNNAYLTPELRQLVRESFELGYRDDFAGYLPVPGDSVTRVVRLISVSADCIFAEALRDDSAVSNRAAYDPTLWVVLRPQARQANVSGWGYVYEGFDDTFGPPLDPCAAG